MPLCSGVWCYKVLTSTSRLNGRGVRRSHLAVARFLEELRSFLTTCRSLSVVGNYLKDYPIRGRLQIPFHNPTKYIHHSVGQSESHP